MEPASTKVAGPKTGEFIENDLKACVGLFPTASEPPPNL